MRYFLLNIRDLFDNRELKKSLYENNEKLKEELNKNS